MVKKRREISVWLVTLLILGLSMTLLMGTMASSAVTVRMWIFPLTADDNKILFDPIIEKFSKQYPDIKVMTDIHPWTNRMEKLVTSIVGGRVPEIAYLNTDTFSGLADGGVLLPLDDYISSESWNDLELGIREGFSWEGHFYVMPMLLVYDTQVYNKDMFKAAGLDPELPPDTWDDLLEYCEKLTIDKNGRHSGEKAYDRSAGVVQWGLTETLQVDFLLTIFDPWLWQAGGSWFNEERTKCLFNSKEGVEALNMVVKLYDNYISPADRGERGVTMFRAERAAIYLFAQQHWIKRMKGEYPDLNFGLGRTLKYRERVGEGNVAGYAIFKDSRNPEAAWKWIEFFTNTENMAKFCITTGFTPPRKSSLEIFLANIEPYMKITVQKLQSESLRVMVHPKQREISEVTIPEIQAAVLHQKSVKQALDDATRKVNEILDDYFAWQK